MTFARIIGATRRRFLLSAIAGGALEAEDDSFPATPSSFGRAGKAILETVLSEQSYRGQIRASDVAALMKTEGLSRDGLMLKLIPVAKSFAHPPLSNYFVGAVALGNSGNLYLGCNIEIPRNMLGLAVHAEQAAIANAYMSNEEGVEALTVAAPPCGHCRQFLSEVSLDVSMRLIMRDGSSIRLSDLLPQSFGPKNLGLTQGSFPVKSTRMRLVSSSIDALVLEAWKAACAAYSPYSRSPSGVALLTAKGRVFAGSYIENAAFNPSLPPLETALAGYFADGGNAGQIQRAVLVERDNAGVSHRLTTQSVLEVLAPGARLESVSLTSA